MTTNTTPSTLAVILATLFASLTLGCDEGADTPDSFAALAPDVEAEILAEVPVEGLYPVIAAERDVPAATTELAAPDSDDVPVAAHYLYPGQPGWIPTCILGTTICVTNSNGSTATYLANLSMMDVSANSTKCDVWYYDPPGAGGFVSNAAWSPGPLSFSTSCAYGF